MARQKSKGFTPKKGNFSIYVLVDGECEQDYLTSIKTVEPFQSILSSQKVKIAPDIPKTKSLDAQFKAVSKALDDYDKVFWIVDYDVIRKETLMQKKGTQTSLEKFSVLSKKFKELVALKKYKDKEVYVLINNPSIEFWYLLHYENTSRLYTTSEEAEKKEGKKGEKDRNKKNGKSKKIKKKKSIKELNSLIQDGYFINPKNLILILITQITQ